MALSFPYRARRRLPDRPRHPSWPLSAEELSWASRAYTQIVAKETTADLKIDTIVSGEKLGEVERDAVKYFAANYQSEGHALPAIIASQQWAG